MHFSDYIRNTWVSARERSECAAVIYLYIHIADSWINYITCTFYCNFQNEYGINFEHLGIFNLVFCFFISMFLHKCFWRKYSENTQFYINFAIRSSIRHVQTWYSQSQTYILQIMMFGVILTVILIFENAKNLICFLAIFRKWSLQPLCVLSIFLGLNPLHVVVQSRTLNSHLKKNYILQKSKKWHGCSVSHHQ